MSGLSRPLRLLDLTGFWPAANGAWARAIHDHLAGVDGLLHSSAMAGRTAVTLFTHAQDSFPAAPGFSRALADSTLAPIVEAAARRFNYAIA